jgi:curli biogenesis system outer membrane secretion channel CsgG
MNKDMDGSNTAAHSDYYKQFAAQTGTKDADDVGLKLNTMLTTALQSTGRFVIVERQDFGDIKSEQALTDQGQTTTQTGAKKGSILGAEIMVRCAITEFVADAVKERSGGGITIPGGVSIGGGGGRKKAKVTLDLKLYEVATSKILYTDTASGDSTSKGGGFSIGGSSGGYGGTATFGKSTNDPIEKATRDAITNVVNKIIKKMDTIPWEGKVALAEKDDDGKMMYVINRGEIDGVHAGDELLITRPGKVIVDPDTGEKLGRSEDKILGTCKVLAVNKNTSTIAPDGAIEVKVGAIVKYRQ